MRFQNRQEAGKELAQHLVHYKKNSRLFLRNKIAIIVDDGLATGITARAAIRSIRLERPTKVVPGCTCCSSRDFNSFRA